VSMPTRATVQGVLEVALPSHGDLARELF
jgi:hypothetical protein